MFIKICLQESRLLISSGSSQEIIDMKTLIDVTLLRSILPFKPGTCFWRRSWPINHVLWGFPRCKFQLNGRENLSILTIFTMSFCRYFQVIVNIVEKVYRLLSLWVYSISCSCWMKWVKLNNILVLNIH